MLTAGHSKLWPKGEAQAHDHRKTAERFHYNDGLNAARGIIAATLLSISLWLLAWTFLFSL